MWRSGVGVNRPFTITTQRRETMANPPDPPSPASARAAVRGSLDRPALAPWLASLTRRAADALAGKRPDVLTPPRPQAAPSIDARLAEDDRPLVRRRLDPALGLALSRGSIPAASLPFDLDRALDVR